MLKHEYLACLKVRKKLTEHLKGNIVTTIGNDILTVYIKPRGGLKYKYDYTGIHFEMYKNEINVDKVAGIIIKHYKNFIFKTFFRREDKNDT